MVYLSDFISSSQKSHRAVVIQLVSLKKSKLREGTYSCSKLPRNICGGLCVLDFELQNPVLVTRLHDLDCLATAPQGQMLRALIQMLTSMSSPSALPSQSPSFVGPFAQAQLALRAALTHLQKRTQVRRSHGNKRLPYDGQCASFHSFHFHSGSSG